jgi:hypothetical protein
MFLLEGTAVTTFLKRNAPYSCAALHVIAAGGTLMLLRGGSEAVTDISQRIGYLGEHPDRWRAGWLLWMVAAMSLAGFYAWWGSRIAMRPALTAFAIAALGLVCDFAGESLFIAWIPAPNAALHRTASLLTGGAGNGLYSVAGILLTLASPSLSALLRGWAWLAWASGIALTIFTILNIPSGVVIASAALMILFIPWVILMGAKLR